jgi:thiol:disulfide interchange protein
MSHEALFLLGLGVFVFLAGVVLARLIGKAKAAFPVMAIGAIAILNAFVLPLEAEDDRWMTDLAAAQAKAKAEGKPMLVDAWARWCASCLELGKITFKDEAVLERLDAFVLVKVDMDAEANEALWEDFEIPGLPWVGFFDASGKLQPKHTLNAYETPEVFLARLDRVQGKGGAELGKQLDSSIASRVASSGWLLTLLLIFVAGFGVSLTPCVYPLIPITMTVIGTRASAGFGQRLALSLTFVAGLAVTYTAMGLVAGLTGAGLGTAMQSPYVTGSLGILFALMALSYLDIFTLQLPGGLQDRLSGAGGSGFVGALVMGLVAGLIAAPCAGPVTVAILAYIAETRDPLIGVALMLAFSMGLGLIFVVIGTSTELTKRLPKSGPWMDILKLGFAVVLFALGFYYVSLAFPVINTPFEWAARLI